MYNDCKMERVNLKANLRNLVSLVNTIDILFKMNMTASSEEVKQISTLIENVCYKILDDVRNIQSSEEI